VWIKKEGRRGGEEGLYSRGLSEVRWDGFERVTRGRYVREEW
jgi:hypothetical protein